MVPYTLDCSVSYSKSGLQDGIDWGDGVKVGLGHLHVERAWSNLFVGLHVG